MPDDSPEILTTYHISATDGENVQAGDNIIVKSALNPEDGDQVTVLRATGETSEHYELVDGEIPTEGRGKFILHLLDKTKEVAKDPKAQAAAGAVTTLAGFGVVLVTRHVRNKRKDK
jgi:hypothetical protein